MLKQFLLSLFVASISIINSFADHQSKHAISYEGGSRFGDRVLGYAQARYLSYATNLSFLYRSFPYSDQLSIEFEALPYDDYSSRYTEQFFIYSAATLTEFFRKIRDPNTPSTLFYVKYFPSDITEWDRDPSRTLLVNVPWSDPQFAQYLKHSLLPRVAIPQLKKEGRLNVADHVRTLSGEDTETSIIAFPLKHPNVDYHKRQIKKIYEWNLKRPMHVFLFSDTKQPQQMVDDFRRTFRREDITFEIQFHERADTDHVIQDFFAMQQFDVLIATQSNFSMMAARVGTFDMVISPVHVIGQYPNFEVNRVQVTSRAADWFPYDLNVILKEE